MCRNFLISFSFYFLLFSFCILSHTPSSCPIPFWHPRRLPHFELANQPPRQLYQSPSLLRRCRLPSPFNIPIKYDHEDISRSCRSVTSDMTTSALRYRKRCLLVVDTTPKMRTLTPVRRVLVRMVNVVNHHAITQLNEFDDLSMMRSHPRVES